MIHRLLDTLDVPRGSGGKVRCLAWNLERWRVGWPACWGRAFEGPLGARFSVRLRFVF